jgi:hypothetical protein
LSIFAVAHAQAQTEAGAAQAKQSSSTVVTASVSAEGVRFASPEEGLRMKVEIYSEAGERLFGSDFSQGNIIDLKTADVPQVLSGASYLCVVTFKDLRGRTGQRLGTMSAQGGQLALRRTRAGKLSGAQAGAIQQSEDEAALAILNEGTPTAATVTAHDGQDGQVTSTSGALTLRTGDVLSGKDKEHVRITPEGQVGIGTDKPEATLDVAGTIRARGGIRFDDGTVLNSASDLSAKKSSSSSKLTAEADGSTPTAAAVEGTGTTGKLLKWTDGVSGTAGDSALFETGGKIGIGTNTPLYPVHIASPTFGQLFVSGGSAADFLMFHSNAPVNSRWTGLRSQDGRGKISSFNDNGTYRLENILTWNNTNGNMSIGAAPGAEKLEVTGNLKLNGATNGIIFPDGSKMTTAGGSTNAVQFVPGAEQLSVGDANGTAAMINLRGGSTCCSGPGGHTPAFFKVFQNGSFVATGNLGIGVSPMQGKGYRTSWDSYKGAFRSGYADNEWDDATVGFFSWAGGSNSTAEGLYALAFGDTNFARSTSSIAFGSGNEVKGAAGFSAGAGNRVCDTYGVAFGNKAQSGGPLINGKCDPDTFNIRGLAAVALGYNVTADQDHTTALGKFATNNGFSGTFIWSDGSATASADTFRNTANNEFAARATGGFRFRTNLGGTTGCNLPAGSGVFNCTSSRLTKENFLDVRGEDVLSSLRKIPVTSWNYISEGSQVRHLGPMAEDFYQAFGLGTGNTSIGVQDLAGVSLAAVKALEARTAELQQKTAEVEQLRTRLSTLEQRLAAIEENMRAKEQK